MCGRRLASFPNIYGKPAESSFHPHNSNWRPIASRNARSFSQGSNGFKANAINKTLGRFARRLLETSMQRSVRCAKRVNKVLRSQGLFASLPHDILRLQQERIGRRQMVLRPLHVKIWLPRVLRLCEQSTCVTYCEISGPHARWSSMTEAILDFIHGRDQNLSRRAS
jgi:hypothetical protein